MNMRGIASADASPQRHGWMIGGRHRGKGPAMLLAMAMLLCTCAELEAQSTINPPVDGVFDWYFRVLRPYGLGGTIYIYIDNTPQMDPDGKVVAGANNFQVAPCPPNGGRPIKTGNCQVVQNQKYKCPYVEGMPGNNCPAFTIGNSVRRAMASWNAGNTGWKFAEVASPEGSQVITVRMSRVAKGDAPEELTEDLQAWPGDNGMSEPQEVPRIDDPRNPPHGGANDASRGVVAFFRCLQPKPAKLGVQKSCQKSELVFNYHMPWGISTTNENGNDSDCDPIVVALHEMGHALRLDHDTPELKLLVGGFAYGLKSISVGTPNGLIMRPTIAPGVHNVNPTDPKDSKKNYARNPRGPAGGGKANTDTNSAAASAANPVP